MRPKPAAADTRTDWIMILQAISAIKNLQEMNPFVNFRKHTQIGREERHARYRGTARVDVSHLKLDGGSQRLSSNKVERLVGNFANEGCQRLEPANRIAALVSQQELAMLARCSNLTPWTLLHAAKAEEQPPKITLPVNTTLRVLHGQHRLEAAKSHFPSDDAWWTVDLFQDGKTSRSRSSSHSKCCVDMSSVLIGSLREEYSNPRATSDGEVFRHIRLYHRQEKICQELKWWACLTQEKAKDLKGILAVKELRERFDDLLDITGLWDEFRIGPMRRYLTLKCHEVATDFPKRFLRADRRQELSTYLRRVRHVWSKITSSNRRIMNLVDAATVKHLELRAPAASERDANFARTCMDGGKIFAQVLDPLLRKTIINNISAVERVIPSLGTFFEDIKYLEPCAQAVKLLLGLHNKSTIYEALCGIFVGSKHDPQRLVRQDGENHFVQTDAEGENQFEFGYRQLWIYAMRHLPDLVNVGVEDNPTEDSLGVRKPNSILWYRFARLALKLGFRSRKIELMGSVNALDDAILECLSQVAGIVSKGASQDRQVAETRDRLQIETDNPLETPPSLTTETSVLDFHNRRSFEEDSRRNAKREFFIRWLYDIEEPRGRYISHFFVQRAMFQAFFGSPRRKKDQQLETSDRNPALEDHEAESRTVNDALFTQSAKYAHIDNSIVLKPRIHGIRDNKPSSEQIMDLENVDVSPRLSDILSPRNEETGSQKSLAEIMFGEPIQRGICNPWEYNSVAASSAERVKENYVSPFTHQADKETVLANKLLLRGSSVESSPTMLFERSDLAMRPRWDSHLESSISPLTLSRQSDSEPSVAEKDVDDTPSVDAEEGLLTILTPTSEVAPSPQFLAFTGLPEASQTSSRASAVYDTGSISSEDSVLSFVLGDCSGAERGTLCGTSKRPLEFDTVRESPVNFLNSSDPNAPTVQFGWPESSPRLNTESTDLASPPLPPTSEGSRRPVARIIAKRVREIVAEDQSCDHASAFYSSALAERNSTKRNFGSAGLQDIQRAQVSPEEGEELTVKRRRISVP